MYEVKSVGRLFFVAAFGLVLSGCTAAALPEHQGNRQLDAAACKQFSPNPSPMISSNKFISISVKSSFIAELAMTGNAALERVSHDLSAAADQEMLTGSPRQMIIALNDGLSICHQLGLKTES
jgi:hypothetical protein